MSAYKKQKKITDILYWKLHSHHHEFLKFLNITQYVHTVTIREYHAMQINQIKSNDINHKGCFLEKQVL